MSGPQPGVVVSPRNPRAGVAAGVLGVLALAALGCPSKGESSTAPGAGSASASASVRYPHLPPAFASGKPLADPLPRCGPWGCTIQSVTPETQTMVAGASHALILAVGSGKSALTAPPRPTPGMWAGAVGQANEFITFDASATDADIATIKLLPDTKSLEFERFRRDMGPLDLSVLTALPKLVRLKIDPAVKSLAPLVGLPIESLNLNTTIKIDDLTPLAKMHALRELSIYVMPSLDPIAALVDLEWLTAGGRELATLHGLESLKHLSHLKIESGSVKDVSALASSTELHDLILRSVNATSIPDLSGLTKLQNVDLRGNDLTDLTHLPKPSKGLTGITILRVGNNKRLKDIGVVAQLTALSELDVSNTAVDSLAAVAKATNLSHLDLVGCPVKSLAPLTTVKTLRVVRVSKDFPATEIEALKKAVPEVKVELGT